MELICVDDKFLPEILAFYTLHRITTPKEGNFYTPRSISKNSEGNWEILLNEIINGTIPIKHPVLGVYPKEPAWRLSRFSTLLGDVVTEEMIKEFKNQEKLIKNE